MAVVNSTHLIVRLSVALGCLPGAKLRAVRMDDGSLPDEGDSIWARQASMVAGRALLHSRSFLSLLPHRPLQSTGNHARFGGTMLGENFSGSHNEMI